MSLAFPEDSTPPRLTAPETTRVAPDPHPSRVLGRGKNSCRVIIFSALSHPGMDMQPRVKCLGFEPITRGGEVDGKLWRRSCIFNGSNYELCRQSGGRTVTEGAAESGPFFLPRRSPGQSPISDRLSTLG